MAMTGTETYGTQAQQKTWSGKQTTTPHPSTESKHEYTITYYHSHPPAHKQCIPNSAHRTMKQEHTAESTREQPELNFPAMDNKEEQFSAALI